MNWKALAKEILNSRVRLYHMDTQTWYTGWVYDHELPRVCIGAPNELELSGTYMVTVQSDRSVLNCVATITGEDVQETFHRKAPLMLASGSSLPNAAPYCYYFEIKSDVHHKSNPNRARKAITPIEAKVLRPHQTVLVAMHDVAPMGAGLMSVTPFQRGEIVKFCHSLESEDLILDAEIKHCRRLPTPQVSYFIGVEFCRSNRINGAKWKVIFDEAGERPTRSPIVNHTESPGFEEPLTLEVFERPLPSPVKEAIAIHAVSLLQRLQRVSQVERRLVLRHVRESSEFGLEAMEDAMVHLDNKLAKLRHYESELEVSLYQAIEQLRREDRKRPRAA